MYEDDFEPDNENTTTSNAIADGSIGRNTSIDSGSSAGKKATGGNARTKKDDIYDFSSSGDLGY
jgi:hypothetical protein